MTKKSRTPKAPEVKSQEGGSGEALYSDEAIRRWDEDVLDRPAIVERLRKAILGWPTDRSLVMALTAPWGTGKSSVLNLLKADMEAADEALIITFDPWFFNSSEALIQGFLTEVETRLRAEPGFSLRKEGKQAWSKARRTLSSVPSVSLFGFGVNFSNLAEGAPSLEDLREAIASLCSNLSKRVVIIFDDVDRLPSSDVLIVLKLIKIWTGFTPFTYVIAYDRHATEAKLGDEINADPKLLQKLIQVEVGLPPASTTRIGRYVDDSIDAFSKNYALRYEDDFEVRLGQMWRESISIGLRTIRDVKRYLNAIAFSLPMVRGEVNYADLFGMEYVRMLFPDAYEYVRTHKGDFAGPTESSPYYKNELNERHSAHETLIQSEKDGDLQKSLKEILSLLFPKFQLSIHKVSGSHDSLEEWTREKRIASVDRFDTYFWLSLGEGGVSDVWIQALIEAVRGSDSAEGVNELFGQALERARGEGNVAKFLERMMLFAEKVPENRTELLIDAVISQHETYETKSGFAQRSEYDTAGALVYALAAIWQGTAEIQQKLLRLVQTGPWGFASHIVHFAEQRLNLLLRNFDHLDQNELRLALRTRFQNDVADADVNILLIEPIWGTNVLYQLKDRPYVTDYLIEVFKSAPSAFGPFLARYVWTPFDGAFQITHLAELVDIGRLSQGLKGVSFPEWEEPEERFAFDFVMAGKDEDPEV